MRLWVLSIVFWLMGPGLAMAAPAHPANILLASEEWEDYTRADGSGLGWDIMRKVFEPAGVTVSIRVEPYLRAVGLVQRGEAQAWVGSYRDEANALYPRWNYDTDHIYALGLASRPAPTLDTLGNYRLAWVRGYELHRYLPHIKRYNEVQRRTGILAMLDHDRADYYIDALNEIQTVIRQAPDAARYKRTHVAELPLYLGFADTAEGRQLRTLFDQRMDHLVPSGELREIFAKWGQPYPFDIPTPHN